ncbi:hypothetical protein K3495_g3021 [Podosphaera aphanis]|nr:hypothetical protein K3495_g3021 [Podosphaera aphanis]
MEFDYYDNYLDLMDDKAISHYVSEFRTTWRKSVKPRSHRRLLLEMLSRPEVSIKAIIQLIESGHIPEDWLIVSLYPKEREFKLAARMLSIMVFEMRAFFACIEANLAEKVFPCIPQQTMTLTKNKMIQRFGKLTRPSRNDNVCRLFLDVDLSRWNLRWRDMPIRMIGEDLNDTFGMRQAFSIVHSFFKKCMILVRVPLYELEGLDLNPPPASDLLWYNHEGGFKGIALKTWSLATFSMIDLRVNKWGFNYNLVGQSDNQVVLAYLTIPSNENQRDYVRRLSDEITASIAEECEKVGQDAKPDECLESTSVVPCSKDVYVRGTEYYLSLEAVSRIFPHGTSDFPTILNKVESLGAACLAAAEKLDNPVLGYYLFLFNTIRYLFRLKRYPPVEPIALTNSDQLKIIRRIVRQLVVLPGQLGGMPIPTIINFMYKGGSDPLLKVVSGIGSLGKIDERFIMRYVHQILTKQWTDRTERPQLILPDPYSLPISTPPSAQSKVQVVSFEHVKNSTKNVDI